MASPTTATTATGDLFAAEEEVLAKAKAFAGDEALWGGADPKLRTEHAALARRYGTLLKQTRRLVRVSDLSAQEVKLANQRISQQNVELEAAYTALKRAQAELVQAQKAAALSTLVAGVAHEINTPVGVIRTANSTLQQQAEQMHAALAAGALRKSDLTAFLAKIKRGLEIIESNSARAADLISGFKLVAVDRSNDERRVFALPAYLREVANSLAPELQHTELEVVIDTVEPLPAYDGYPGAIAQIATNLILNSVMHGYGDDCPQGTLIFALSLCADHRIEVLYSDGGNGVPEEIQATMFEPFVTTKRGRGGSGLGLHIVQNLVCNLLGGAIRYVRPPGRGAGFEIVIPAVAPHDGLVEPES